MSTTIPAIDFRGYLSGSPEERQLVVSDIDSALSTIGCFSVYNHSIKQETIDRCFELSKQFFNLEDQHKQALSQSTESLEHGYCGFGKEIVRGQTSRKEDYNFGGPEYLQGLWPKEEQLPGFRTFAGQFHQECSQLIHTLLECVSSALNLATTESLGQYHTGSTFATSLLHYPHEDSVQTGPRVRNPAHADLSTLTLLFQQDVGGLEVADMSSTDKTLSADVEKSARFIPAMPGPGILVLPGFFLARWSSDKYRGAVHRVSAPFRSPSVGDPINQQDDETGLLERYSIAFFGAPDVTTIITPLSTNYDNQKPARGPLNVGKFLLKKRGLLHLPPS